MKDRYEKTDEDIQIAEYHEKQSEIFIDEFDQEIQYMGSSDEHFSDELKTIQRLAMNGILSPKNKTLFHEWQMMYPDRFDHFCEQLSDENRLKLHNFLQL